MVGITRENESENFGLIAICSHETFLVGDCAKTPVAVATTPAPKHRWSLRWLKIRGANFDAAMVIKEIKTISSVDRYQSGRWGSFEKRLRHSK